jgi:hypothetical protein
MVAVVTAWAVVFVTYLKMHPELRTVYLTGFWVHEATGRSYRNAPEIDADEAYDGSGPAYDPIAFRRALDRLIEMFPHRNFVILDDVPSGPELDLQQYARSIFAGHRPPPGLPRVVANSQRAAYEPILKAIASTHQDVRYAPVLANLRGPTMRPLFGPDGTSIYKNRDHLSPSRSAKLAPDLALLFGAPS